MNRAGYRNHGGIGLTSNEHGDLDGLAGNELRSLNLRDAAGKVIVHQEPSVPWTFESITKALGEFTHLTAQHSPVDAFLGDVFLGSTEL